MLEISLQENTISQSEEAEHSSAISMFKDAYDTVSKSIKDHPCIYSAGAAVASGIALYASRGRLAARFSRTDSALSKTGLLKPEIKQAAGGESQLFGEAGAGVFKETQGKRLFLGEVKGLNGTGLGGESGVSGIRFFSRGDHDFHENMHVALAADEGVFEKLGKPIEVIGGEANQLRPQRMTPRAYKVVMEDGTSLFDSATKYPLPKLGEDGAWVPSKWVEPGDSIVVKTVQSSVNKSGGRKGLYITSKPGLWEASRPGRHTYEVEIGDTASLEAWNHVPQPLRVDFTAQRIRLLRRVPDSELSKMHISAEDYRGLGAWENPGQMGLQELMKSMSKDTGR